MPGSFQKMKNYVTGEDEDKGLVDELKDDLDCCGSLSWSTRIKGFAICFVIGIALSIIGVVMVFLQKYTAFALIYSCGSLIALTSSMFLMGPCKQLKRMFEEKRFIATIVVLLAIVLTICAAVWWKIPVLALVFCLVQFLAMAWYCLSYIPYARTLVKNCATSCLA
ncbi:vesicle transport protein SFT2B-like [Sycon ciliatum]|uniref:vesicle transport protein SFT2B-like n=1 Tax=Sycon ciliatum TaxID=27933 RepID=UPI0020AD82C1|eukprot:scpid19743/ scgid19584/ Vesicle transport protein SFT2B; SFT2 domain-containing protein 2